jgi:hypothetical protein
MEQTNQTSAAAPTPAETPQTDTTLVNLRSRRIQDLLVASLGEPDPLEANLGTLGCDMMDFAQLLKMAITQRFSNGPSSLPFIELELHLRCTRQAERLSQPRRRRRTHGEGTATQNPNSADSSRSAQ